MAAFARVVGDWQIFDAAAGITHPQLLDFDLTTFDAQLHGIDATTTLAETDHVGTVLDLGQARAAERKMPLRGSSPIRALGGRPLDFLRFE